MKRGSIFLIPVMAIIVAAGIASYSLLRKHPICFFDNIKEMQTLSGDAQIVIRTESPLNFLELSVDGKAYASQNVEDYGKGRFFGFGLPTYEFTNGPHVLGVGLGRHILAYRRVLFRNPRRPLRSTVLSRAAAPMHISGTVYPDAPWKAIVEDERGRTLHVWHGNGFVIDLSWDGKDASGRRVPNGTYQFVATTEPLGEAYTCPMIVNVPPHD